MRLPTRCKRSTWALLSLLCLCAGQHLLAQELFLGNLDSIQRFNSTTGDFVDTFVLSQSGSLNGTHDMAFGPDGNLYVASEHSNAVLRYNSVTGAFMDAFASGNGLSNPTGLLFRSDGYLYVSSAYSSEVKRFNAKTGAFVDNFVVAGSGGLSAPIGLAFGADGNLYVSSGYSNEVKRYNGATGAFMDNFVPAGPEGVNGPNELTFGPDGNLYVCSNFSHEIRRYRAKTGDFIDSFVIAQSGGLINPYGLVFGPDGYLYVSSTGTNEIKRYDGLTGAYVDTFLSGHSIHIPSSILFRSPASTRVGVSNLTAAIGIRVALVAYLYRKTNNQLVPDSPVTFKIADKVIGTATTDANGRAKLTYRLPDSFGLGAKKLEAVYSGALGLEASLGTGRLTVTRAATAIKVSNMRDSLGQTVTLTAILRRTTDNTLLAKRVLTFAVNGVPVGTATTDSAGKATLRYIIPADLGTGDKPITVTFPDGAIHLGSTGTGTLTVTPQ